MAIVVPIVSQWNGKGLQKAVREFKSLDGVAAKTGFVLKKAAMGATVGFAALATAGVGVATALFGAARAADADRKSQTDLMKTAKQFANANDLQVYGLEKTIDTLMRATGVADDDLRPAMSRLLRSTKDVTKAQRLLRLAMDISGRTGADLNDVVQALGKGADGATRGLQALGIGFTKAELKGKSLDDIVAMLEARFKGGAADAANTFEGRVARLKVRFGEMWEQVGYKVLPILERLMDAAIRVADAFAENGLSGAIKQFKAELVMSNFANTGIGKFFGAMYEAIRTIVNAVIDLPGGPGDSAKLASWQAVTSRMSYEAAANANAYMGASPLAPGREAEVLRQFYNNMLNRGMTPNQAARTIPGITININTNDPQVILDALRRASRQQNGLTGVRIR